MRRGVRLGVRRYVLLRGGLRREHARSVWALDWAERDVCGQVNPSDDNRADDADPDNDIGIWRAGSAPVWGDYNRDGWPDLAVTAGYVLVVFKNNGDGTFAVDMGTGMSSSIDDYNNQYDPTSANPHLAADFGDYNNGEA